MTDSTPTEVELAWDTFHQVVNMTAEELRTWLLNHRPDRPAVPGELGPPLQELGLKVVQLLSKRKADLTGQAPFHGEPLAVALAHQQQPLPTLPPWVPAPVAALVADLTAKDPTARPASASQVAERAELVRAALTATATSPHSLPTRASPATGRT